MNLRSSNQVFTVQLTLKQIPDGVRTHLISPILAFMPSLKLPVFLTNF